MSHEVLSAAPEAVKRLMERIGRAQGCEVRVFRETSGYHIYFPCPACLQTHGARELKDPKYALNASKYLGIGKYAGESKASKRFNPAMENSRMEESHNADLGSGICMRTRDQPPGKRHMYTMTEILSMPTITERHPDIMTRKKLVGMVGNDERESFWVPHPYGNGAKCPPYAGDMVPIHVLAITQPNHPAVEYILGRRYDPVTLWNQFRCAFCVHEWPHKKNQVFYPKMPGGWRDTPQHRIIFHSMINGEPMTWQGRFIEKLSDDGLDKFALNPYELKWDHVATRSNIKSAWIPVAPFDALDERGNLRWSPSKYRTAKHSSRELMGWDAAIERANKSEGLRWCVLGEGPLDGARVGPGGIALIGKSISDINAMKVAQNFHIAFTAFDNDRAGREATEKVTRSLLSNFRGSILHSVVPLPLPAGKDPGDQDQGVFDDILDKSIRRAERGL